ncbi:hypothetical protein ONZ45_g4062 [Pleurotus djamor]|nr:hypothetical protein ONZ45_g4062 [Pleurotus djamor]
MSTKPTQVKLPQWLRDFTNPDPRVNPHFERILDESSQWINSYGFNAYQKQEIELFGALVYPSSDYPVVRLGADFIHYLFALDEITDEQDSSGARSTLGLVQLGFEKPKEDHSSPSSLAMAEYKFYLFAEYLEIILMSPSPSIFNRFSSLAAGVNSTERFVAHMRSYLKAVITQATLREQNQGFVSVYEYRKERRQNSAVLLVYDLVELQSGIDLPSAVYDSPEFSKVYFAAVDIICITNAIGHTELYSYVTVYMNQYRFDLAEAIEHADREGNYDQRFPRRMVSKTGRKGPRDEKAGAMGKARYASVPGSVEARLNGTYAFSPIGVKRSNGGLRSSGLFVAASLGLVKSGGSVDGDKIYPLNGMWGNHTGKRGRGSSKADGKEEQNPLLEREDGSWFNKCWRKVNSTVVCERIPLLSIPRLTAQFLAQLECVAVDASC